MKKVFFTFMLINLSYSQLGQAMGHSVKDPPSGRGGGGGGGTSSSSSSASSVPTSGNVTQDIVNIAKNSSCAALSWSDRGRAPAGFVKGMSLTFARSLCRRQSSDSNYRSPASLMSSANTNNSTKDAFTHYENNFDSLNLEIDHAGNDTLRSLYTLGIGLGMRESSGKYCEGYDASIPQNSASEAEAGMFQTSYNSVGASVELQKLMSEYKANPNRCFLGTFKEGVTCRNSNSGVIGSGTGAEFQRLAKSCPAFAAEYAMVTLRVLRKHYGPINRKEAQLSNSCNKMLDEVQDLVLSNVDQACAELK